MKLSIATLVQGMTDQRCKLLTTERLRWFPLWMLCCVKEVNGKYVISTTPY